MSRIGKIDRAIIEHLIDGEAKGSPDSAIAEHSLLIIILIAVKPPQ